MRTGFDIIGFIGIVICIAICTTQGRIHNVRTRERITALLVGFAFGMLTAVVVMALAVVS